ncbi:MAG: UDP-2,4-diacetamido-2,4,6-trideoxy-beta-L-altropyranose hydrolase [Bacteroidetes bacterium]|nr:UDP-2,4-diacetamido-2,4,6-trideoxy-beta-L-altropyranose hydrolase [Bacteroidota bacterium]
MKTKIIIRADGGTSIGMGHVIRCLALADMLKDDFNIIFAIQDPTDSVIRKIHSVTETIIHLPKTDDYNSDALHFSQFLEPRDIIIIDGYHFKTNYQKEIKKQGAKLVVIDDLHSWHHVADVIINHAAGIDKTVYSTEAYSKLFLGLDYALLRKPFLKTATETKKIKTVKKVFISMGAADINNITQKYTEALIQTEGIEEIHLMLGSINPNIKSIDQLIENNSHIKIIKHFEISADELASLLTVCDVSICPASSISLESCAIGIGLISGFTAENQLGILTGMEKHKTLINFGDMNTITIPEIKTKLKDIVGQPEKLNSLIQNQKKIIDGNSPKRLKEIFKNLITEKIHFRFAKESDADLYFNWTNDELVRSNSYNQNKVEYDNHIKWFLKNIISKDYHFYLFFNEDNMPIGQVRIAKNEKEVLIGISIDESFRGKSLGAEMIIKSTNDYLSRHDSDTITAYIKIENKASLSIFKKAGFSNEEITTEQGVKSYKLFKKHLS